MKGKSTKLSGTLSVCVFVFPGANIGTYDLDNNIYPSRINRDFAAANSVWQQEVNGEPLGVQFSIIKTFMIDHALKEFNINTEDIIMTQSKLDENGKLFLDLSKTVYPDADVYVFYLNGSSIGPINRDGKRVLAMSYIDYPIVILSNSARKSRFILAHELGHFLFNFNRFGDIHDPNPYKGDPAHNADPTNLMYPTGIFWPKSPKMPIVSIEQLKKALENKFFFE